MNPSVKTALSALSLLAPMCAAGDVLAVSYSDRATTNNDYQLQHTILCDNTYATGIEAKEQYNYGIIDLRLRCAQSPTYTNWATGNNNQNEIHSRTAPSNNGLAGLLVHEQYNYGVIDVQPSYQSLSTSTTVSWLSALTMNGNASETSDITCPSGQHIVDLNVFEQHGYGVVDVQLICNNFRPVNAPQAEQPENGASILMDILGVIF